jgi:hypothetical protein
MKISYIEDGEKINDNLIEAFNLDNIFYRESSGRKISNFVGFIFNSEGILVSIPKKFISKSEPEYILKERAIILFRVLSKYNSSGFEYDGIDSGFECNIPINSIKNIVLYYNNFGIYCNREKKISDNNVGKVNWKTVFNKSFSLYNGDIFIFSPLYRNSIINIDNIISEIMIYALYLISGFSNFLNLYNFQEVFICPKTIANNFSFILNSLYNYKQSVFKDLDKKLINSLIIFFQSYSNFNHRYKMVTFNFEAVWEKAVENYLNSNFKCYNSVLDNYIFENSQPSFCKKNFIVDDSINKHSISIDHFYQDTKFTYIFDSKYFFNVSDLNYKQIAYSYFVAFKYKIPNEKIKSALILPSNKNDILVRSHLDRCLEDKISIDEIYLPMINVLRNYILL